MAGKRIAFVGDGSGNMARSFLEAAPLFDFTLQLGSPPDFRPPPGEAQAAGRALEVTADPRAAVAGADVVVTDVWTSMGQEAEAAARLKAFQGFTVDVALMARARPGAIVLHCLPAHRGEEITEEVLEGPQSRGVRRRPRTACTCRRRCWSTSSSAEWRRSPRPDGRGDGSASGRGCPVPMLGLLPPRWSRWRATGVLHASDPPRLAGAPGARASLARGALRGQRAERRLGAAARPLWSTSGGRRRPA